MSKRKNKSVLTFTPNEARKFFLKEECYYNFDLPPYFSFQKLLNKVSKKIEGKSLSSFYEVFTAHTSKKGVPDSPRNHEKVNYTLLNNKDGKFSWRPLQLINPAIYVSLVHAVTEKGNWKQIKHRFNETELKELRDAGFPI